MKSLSDSKGVNPMSIVYAGVCREIRSDIFMFAWRRTMAKVYSPIWTVKLAVEVRLAETKEIGT